MSESMTHDAEEKFKNEYDWEELYPGLEVPDGFMDFKCEVCIFPKGEDPVPGLKYDEYTVDEYEVTYHEDTTTNKIEEQVETYELTGENESVLLTKELADRLLDTFGATTQSFRLLKNHNEFPVLLKLDDPDWDAMIAPRLPPSDFNYK